MLTKVDPDTANLVGFEYGNMKLWNKLLSELKSIRDS